MVIHSHICRSYIVIHTHTWSYIVIQSTFAYWPSFRRLSAGTTRSVSGEKLKARTVQLPHHPPDHREHRDHHDHDHNDHDDQDEDCFQMNCISKPLLQKYSWQPIVQECIIYHREYILRVSIIWQECLSDKSESFTAYILYVYCIYTVYTYPAPHVWHIFMGILNQ